MAPSTLAPPHTGRASVPRVIGRVVDKTFLLGRGAGVRITEEVVRRRPPEEGAMGRAEQGSPGVYRRRPG